MANLPQVLLDQLAKAESDYEDALHADDHHNDKVIELTQATEDEAEAKQASLAAHQTAAESANVALNALKIHFGIA